MRTWALLVLPNGPQGDCSLGKSASLKELQQASLFDLDVTELVNDVAILQAIVILGCFVQDELGLVSFAVRQEPPG